MRFTGVMNDIMCIKQFSSIVTIVGRLSKTCVLQITPTNLYFIVNEAGSVGAAPGLWAQMDQGHFFTVFNMGGVSEEHNMIFLELQSDKLSRTMNSFKTAQAAVKSLKIKLTKKHSPCLTLEVELPSISMHSRTVVHDVPVRPVPRRQWPLYHEPEMPRFNVSVYLPPLRQLRQILERMKSLAPHVTLAGNRCGTLVLSVSSDSVAVSSYFRNLSTPSWEDGPKVGDDNDDPERLYAATVDIKKLTQFLTAEQMGPVKVICNIVEGHMIHMFMLHDDVTLQFFLPAATNLV